MQLIEKTDVIILRVIRKILSINRRYFIMNEIKLKLLIYSLISIETAIIISSYYEYLGFISICVGGIYILTAFSDYWSENNIQITRLLLILSLFITIPRVIIQTQEVIEKERDKKFNHISDLPKPIKREIKTVIFDCSRIPNWQGELQMKCNSSNLEQRKLENQAEEDFQIALANYEKDKYEKKKLLDSYYFRFLTPKSVSIILLYIFLTPIIPLLIIFLIHNDKDYISHIIHNSSMSNEKSIELQDIQKNRKNIAKKLLISGFRMEEIQDEVGVSRATLYRWRKEFSEV